MKKILILFMCCVLLSSCGTKEYKKDVFSMDTHITMTAYGKNAQKALDDAEKEIKRINEKFSISNEVDLCDEEVTLLLKKADEITKKTNGAFDLRVAPVVRAWGFYSEAFRDKSYKVPTDEELKLAMAEMKKGEELDFGAVAKGYCADKVAGILRGEGIESAILSLGGNVVAIGNNTNGKPWNVGIKNPFGEGLYATLEVSDTSVVTSGDYVRFFESDGKKYHHIIDPVTGYPAEGELTSVTVICEDSATADALSTAFFVMGKDSALEYWKKDKSFGLVLIDKDGMIYYTDGVVLRTEFDSVKIK